MQFLVIAATKQEIQPFIAHNNKNVEVLITGVGIPATLYHLQKRLQQIDYDFIIQAGIGGTFTETINLAEVVLVKQDTFGDIGMEEKEKFTGIFQSGFADKDEFPFTDGWLVNRDTLFNTSSLQSVNAITVNKVSDSLLQTKQLLQNFGAQTESMEGAAFHYVCLQEHIPFVQIRSISNIVRERSKSKWLMKEAIDNLTTEMINLIGLLTG